MCKKTTVIGLAFIILIGGIYFFVDRNSKLKLKKQFEIEKKTTETKLREQFEIEKQVNEARLKAEFEAEKKRDIWIDKYAIKSSHPNSYDPNSFEVIDEYYAKDKNNVYFIERSSEGTDNSWQAVYKLGLVVGANVSTFVPVRYPYSKDSKYVYCYGEKIAGMDAGTFQYFTMNYAKDKNHAYFENKIITSADSNAFVYLNGFYAKDDKKVYYKDKEIVGVDINTFATANAREAYDKNYNYYDGKIKNKRIN